MCRVIAFLAVWAVLVVSIAPAAQVEINPEQVRRAISDGVAYLKSRQKADGSWPPWRVGMVGGTTSLYTLALLNAGVPPEDESVHAALGYLRKLKLDSKSMTYAVALQTMAFCKARTARDRVLVQRNVYWLEKTQVQTGDGKGAWSYPGAGGDGSNSQFAILALHEAERIGVSVKWKTWQLAKAYWEKMQRPDGSFGYQLGPGHSSTGSMTCAGIASLVITSNRVRQGDATANAERILCCQRNDDDETDPVEEALQWLGKNFQVSHNPHAPTHWSLYYLYGLERVGRLTARRFIGGHDWYREGTAHLVRSKGDFSNHWKGAGLAEDDECIATSFALLFLSKGRRPTLLAKLQHDPDDDWNQHRNDVDNLTRYVESKWKLDLTWQVTNVRAAGVDDLSQSPVLYFCGGKNPLPGSAAGREDLVKKLREYLNGEGFLFAEAYSVDEGFDAGFRELMDQVFPEPEYRLKLLPPEHPIWRTEELVAPDQVRPLWGIDFGCRTSVVYCPPDKSAAGRPSLSCLWELSRAGRGLKRTPAVEAQIKAGLSTGINILAYATNRELKHKDEIPSQSRKRADAESVRRGTLFIANLRHPGGCSAAPRALVNLMEAATEEIKIPTGTEEHDLSITDDAIFDYHLVFMHGRTSFRLTEREREQLREYIGRGGMLFANSICASKAFTKSFRSEMATILSEHPLEPIPLSDPIFSKTYGGFDLATVTRRDPQARSRNESIRDQLRSVPPELEGIRIDDRYAVVFSRYDLSCALQKQNSLECQGYVREDAARIGLNVVLYSLQE